MTCADHVVIGRIVVRTDIATLTPFERPEEFGARLSLTDDYIMIQVEMVHEANYSLGGLVRGARLLKHEAIKSSAR